MTNKKVSWVNNYIMIENHIKVLFFNRITVNE